MSAVLWIGGIAGAFAFLGSIFRESPALAWLVGFPIVGLTGAFFLGKLPAIGSMIQGHKAIAGVGVATILSSAALGLVRHGEDVASAKAESQRHQQEQAQRERARLNREQAERELRAHAGEAAASMEKSVATILNDIHSAHYDDAAREADSVDALASTYRALEPPVLEVTNALVLVRAQVTVTRQIHGAYSTGVQAKQLVADGQNSEASGAYLEADVAYGRAIELLDSLSAPDQPYVEDRVAVLEKAKELRRRCQPQAKKQGQERALASVTAVLDRLENGAVAIEDPHEAQRILSGAKAEADRLPRSASLRKRFRTAQEDIDFSIAQHSWSQACGPQPDHMAYFPIKMALRETANDPDALDVDQCKAVDRKPPPRCWVVACVVRFKNPFGAMMRDVKRFYIQNGKFAGQEGD